MVEANFRPVRRSMAVMFTCLLLSMSSSFGVDVVEMIVICDQGVKDVTCWKRHSRERSTVSAKAR